MKLAEFDLESVYLSENCEREYETGKFSCIEASFALKRKFGYYWVHAFLPSILCVVASMGGFWVHLKLASARVTLSIVAFLTILQHQADLSAGLPKVSYLKVL